MADRPCVVVDVEGCVVVCSKQQASKQASRQAGSDKAAAAAVGWLSLGVSEQAYIGGGNGGWKNGRKGGNGSGRGAGCSLRGVGLARGREGGQWKIAKNFWKPGKRLGCVATQKLMHVSTPIDGERPEILTTTTARI